MKIRIKGNALRFRLTKSEVNALDIDHPIIEAIDFGESILLYSIYCTDTGIFSATFANNEIRLSFPIILLNEWKLTDKVGFKEQSGALSILIEKDFTCLDNIEEDQSDNYPNPLLNLSK